MENETSNLSKAANSIKHDVIKSVFGGTQNYLHTCLETVKCDCGWIGCICKAGYSTNKINETMTEVYQLCPNCKGIVSKSTMTFGSTNPPKIKL